jgi:hypothetical protein
MASCDELLDGEIFYTLKEAQVLIEQWRIHYNTVRPHSSLGYRPPAPQTIKLYHNGLFIRYPIRHNDDSTLSLNLDPPLGADQP